MVERYWLIHANGGRQLIDPELFDLELLAEQARQKGGQLESESYARTLSRSDRAQGSAPRGFQPPMSALSPLFRHRLQSIYTCRVDYTLQMVERPTKRLLGNYYRSRALIRIYSHDTETGRRPTEELFDTFLHELAHHLEYTEFDNFRAKACGRRKGTMHSKLFWRILGELKGRWADSRALAQSQVEAAPSEA